MNVENEINRFYAHGKILLTGEYLVLFGARALAFPLIYGQSMEVFANNTQLVCWKAYSPEGEWFSVDYQLPELTISETSSMDQALYLQKLLFSIKKYQNHLFNKGLNITTRTNFPINWGLGTSSTLIYNLANWAGVDVYKFYSTISKGSGYDIACAGSKGPIVYQRTQSGNPLISSVNFNKNFNKNCHLVFSGIKKPTDQHINDFLLRHHGFKAEIKQISHITDEVIKTNDLDDFMTLLREHEVLVASILGVQPVQEQYFQEFDGVVKSLGAWGGDFYLAVSKNDSIYVKNYFKQFGLSVILPFNETIIH